MSKEVKVGDVIRLNREGYNTLFSEGAAYAYTPLVGSTAVVTSIDKETYIGPRYFVQFFAYAGDEWELYDGEFDVVRGG